MNHELWAAAAGEVVNKSLQVAQVSGELTPGSSLASGLLGFAQVHSSGLPWCWLQALPSSFPTARCLGNILEVMENQSLAGHLRPQLEVDGIALQNFSLSLGTASCYVNQGGHDLTLQLRLTLNLWSSRQVPLCLPHTVPTFLFSFFKKGSHYASLGVLELTL